MREFRSRVITYREMREMRESHERQNTEIRKIDDEFGAFGEIAKDNGVSEDIVYIIKSNFR